MDVSGEKIVVVGLGYVGLPLAVALAQHFNVIGFDIDAGRVRELNDNHDRTSEISTETLNAMVVPKGTNGTPGPCGHGPDRRSR